MDNKGQCFFKNSVTKDPKQFWIINFKAIGKLKILFNFTNCKWYFKNNV